MMCQRMEELLPEPQYKRVIRHDQLQSVQMAMNDVMIWGLPEIK